MAKSKNPARGIRLHGNTYELNIQRNGVRQFINLETDDFAEAIIRAEKVRENPDLGLSDVLPKEIDRFIAYKLRMGQYTRHTALTKKNKLLLMVKSLPENATGETITTGQLQKWHDGLIKKVTSSTIHSYFMTARAFFRWAVEVARIRRNNPVDGLQVVRLEKRAREVFCTFEQRDELIKKCKDRELKFILFCGFHAGMRFNEIVEAIPAWFRITEKIITLTKTDTMRFKDNEERSVPMTIAFQQFLKTYPRQRAFMIAPEATHGKWIYRYDFRAKFTSYMKDMKLEWVTPHTMRHTFASLLVSSGESIYKVSKWLGDRVATVEDHYGHLAPDAGGIEKAFSKRV